MKITYVRWYTTATATQNHIVNPDIAPTFKQYRGPVRKTLCGKEYATSDRVYWGETPQDLGGYYNHSVCPRCQKVKEQRDAKSSSVATSQN